MAALIWGAWSPDWSLGNKVDFDGINKIIYVHPEVTTLNIRTDVYSAWIDWVVLRDNSKFLPALRYTGYDPIGAGVFTGDTYFLVNGWKLSVDLATVRVTGVLFSDDYDTAYYTTTMVAQYPATVSALVSAVSVPATVTATDVRTEMDNNSSKLSTIATNTVPATTAAAVWSHSFAAKLLTVAKFLGLK